MKKTFAVILCFVMLIAVMAPAASAAESQKVYPIIIVPGYSSSSMYKEGKNGEKIHVWGVVMSDILEKIIINAAELGIDLAALAKGDAKKLADTVGREFIDLYKDMAYNENGEPVTELINYHTSASEVNTAYLNKYEDGKYIHEGEIMPYVTQNLGDKAEEWTFNFNTDFRKNNIFCAMDLAILVKDIQEYTGSDKVNILAVSHGGQTSATYFSICSIAARGGKEAEEVASYLGITVERLTELFDSRDIHNAVLTVPAIGGALLCYDVLTNQIKLDEETLLCFIENGMMFETDAEWLVKAEQLGFLDDVLYHFQPYAVKILGYWGSIWDFVPSDTYEKVKENAASQTFLKSDIIKTSDYFHKTILTSTARNLQEAQKRGTNIYLIAGSGWPSVVGSQVNSDAIISVSSSTGAAVAPLGSRFSNGYKTLGTQCSNPVHNHLSPSMEADLSTGYLPETTWLIDGLFHGMTLKDDYSASLMKKLVEEENHVDVHTYKEYPQFHRSTNVCESVCAEFNASVPGYVSSSDTALVITNLSKKNKMRILSVAVDGSEIRFSAKDYAKLRINPRESVSVDFKGKIEKESLTAFNVTISYCIVGSVTPVNEKTITFTRMNGEAPTYDISKPYTSLKGESRFENHISGTKAGAVLAKLGLIPFLEVIYNIVMNVFGKCISAIKGFIK